jgi:two-component system nitrogen regulation response regulator GlnG
MPHSVLIIDDEEAIAWALRKACERQGHRAMVASSAEEGLAQAQERQPDVVFLDVRLPGMDGLTALTRLKEIAPRAKVIIITAHGNLATAVKAVEGGAFDYLAKPFDLDQALQAVARAIQPADNPPKPLEDKIAKLDDELVGQSQAMQTVFKRIALVAPTNSCVLITGESGTGKELVARAIHAHSPRREKPFLPVHVAALNPNLVESELFGHVRGAFTGADRTHPGLIALADGGTVFLDELGDIPLAVQAKLLRVLERQEVLPVGGIQPNRVNVRIVSATNANLAQAVNEGRFRHDLFFRLNVYPIHLPALRDRPTDIPVLARHFLNGFGSSDVAITPEAMAELKRRNWPGNVRELKNAIEHAAIESRGESLRSEHLPEPSELAGSRSLPEQIDSQIRTWVRDRVRQADTNEPHDLYQELLAIVEPAILGEVLQQLDGNRLVAGRWLGLARATVRKLIRKYALEAGSGPEDNEPDEI